MTEQQDVLDPRRPRRRRIPVILLGMLPAAIAATLLVAGPHYVEPVHASTNAAANDKAASSASLVSVGVIAPKTNVNLSATVQQITVTVPKPKVVTPAPKTTVSKTVTVNKTVKKATTTKKAVKKTTKKKSVKKSGSYKSFCANPSNPVSASGSSGKALLTAVNKERAKLGIPALSWSSSMASTATKWSKHMLAVDEKSSDLIDGLAHNPNRPGAENVAVVYSSGGYSASTAISKMHKNLVYSNGHCLNLMNPDYSSMGAGVASSDDGNTWYATENFR